VVLEGLLSKLVLSFFMLETLSKMTLCFNAFGVHILLNGMLGLRS
jgi:hypothetical protein